MALRININNCRDSGAHLRNSLICDGLASFGYLAFKINQIIILLALARIRNSLIYLVLVSPGYLGLKIIQIIVLLIAARLRNSLICVDHACLAYLRFKIIQIIVLYVYVTPFYVGTLHPPATWV